MSTAQEQPINIKAAAWTVLVHALLLLLFYYVTYNVPELETIDEMGIEVNLGTSLDGFGDDQPMALGLPTTNSQSSSSAGDVSATDLPTDILESDDAEAPSINTNKSSNDNNKQTTEGTKDNNNDQPSNANTEKRQARYVYSGSQGTGGNGAATDADGSSEGNSTGNNDMGVPGGTAGADNYEGTPGSGGGISHTLNGRSIVAFPPRDAEFRESGKVTVRITVNRAGNIVSKRIVSASNSQLRNIALQKVSKIKFNKSNTAPEEQFGNITFVFKTRS